jgi:signal transduction histidine kinase/ActR/RegA family two-component response regulator
LTAPLEFGPEGMLQDNLLEWRRALHPVSLRMCVITLLVTLVVVCLFPLVINSIVIQPLDRLVAGVGKVNAGDLGATVAASRPDEIGYLSESFNSMVTSIRTTTAELARHRDNLEGLVADRTEALRQEIQAKELIAGDLERAKSAAEAANQAKSVFLASMSHEIRTPMNGVTGMTSLLLETPLSGEQRHYSETIRNSTEALLTIVNDILDLSKIEAGRLELDEAGFDLRACFEESVDLLSPRAAEKKMEMTCRVDDSLPARAVGDAVRLRQVMLNLLGNALKFTEKGEVSVTVERAALAGLEPAPPPGHFQIECCVRDSGMGIAPEVMARLFQPFSQADSSTTRRFGGTGLGLVISRRLVEAMGGQIWAESPPEGGAAFHFTVNLKADELEPPLWCRAGTSLAGRRFLVVHGHATSRDLIAHYLRLWGGTVDACGSMAEALAGEGRGKTADWDAVLFDEGAVERDGSGASEDSLGSWAEQGVSLVCLAWPGPGAIPAVPLPPGTRLIRKPARPAQLWEEMSVLGPGSNSAGSAAAPTVKSEEVTESSLRVLVADDNEVNLKVATAYLHLLGCQAWVARNGREVLEAVAEQAFDLILMDVQMPEMDGLEAARELGKRFSPADLPIIVGVSAGVSQTEREACFAAGMADFLAKPLRLADMEAGLKRWREWLRLDSNAVEGEAGAKGEEG